MNLLTHLFLAGDSPAEIVGNFIGEVKTSHDCSFYSREIQTAVHYHHLIDTFIGSHPAVERSRKRVCPKYSKYSAAIVDSFYDHFLAARWDSYHSVPLEKFSYNVYYILLDYNNILPFKAKNILPLMIQGNWLTRQAKLSGISEIANEMQVRSSKETYTIYALEDLILNYTKFKEDFEELFSDLTKYHSIVRQFGDLYEPKANSLAMAG